MTTTTWMRSSRELFANTLIYLLAQHTYKRTHAHTHSQFDLFNVRNEFGNHILALVLSAREFSLFMGAVYIGFVATTKQQQGIDDWPNARDTIGWVKAVGSL